ncbi:hypothetical protein ACMZ6Y_08725 [Streptococcus pluranimalium]|uniref:Uncharacterized protein n=2 Tax=Streptococcus TaxID=1301 RepID=V6YZD0_STRAG|nr:MULTISPECIES: hypothetical protein [Streptococcus]ESV53997.1 hypothetical protein SAG0136_01690 [Streptococcus agalactiae LMG 14747]MDY3023911.1 hypothetical protein [Streptococcus hyovaginalis]MDY4511760.1 hypothetical protein [Streptococcus hyovaginalis]MDY5974503.1 hypothetical protein [Streptococcus hyovaginalis]SNV43942.1 hypothetical cytosolic protein [Streptococcus acidominimus]
MNQFEAFKATLSEESLKAIYEESKIEIAGDSLEGTETFSAALATQMAINLVEKYHDWLNTEN